MRTTPWTYCTCPFLINEHPKALPCVENMRETDEIYFFIESWPLACTSRLAPNPSSSLHRLTCCCWKDLSLFLKREGRTKSHPLARKASSPLRSGSRRNDVSLIIMVGAKTHNPPHQIGPPVWLLTRQQAGNQARKMKKST